jgi:AraC family transcriptional regulator
MSTISPNNLTDRIVSLDPTARDWVTSSKFLHIDGLVVAQGVQSPHQIESVFTQHILGILISDRNLQQITRIGDREYDGTFPSGTGFLSPADVPYFAAWRSTDAGLNFALDPLFLTRLAERELGLDRSRVELQSTPFVRDSQITTIASLFQREIETGGMGGRLYAESLRNLLSIHLLRNYCIFSATFSTPIGGLAFTQLHRVLDYIEAHLGESIQLSNLAAIANLSESHFSRSFKLDPTVVPQLTPPGYAFGIIWTLLFICMGTARWLLGKSGDLLGAQHQQLMVILIIFCLIQPFYSTAIGSRLGGLIGTVGAVFIAAVTVLNIRQSSEVAAWLVLPVVIWTMYASLLLIAVIRSRDWSIVSE